MVNETYTDVEMLRDGSYRWLWKVMCYEQLWRAGICMSQSDAETCAAAGLKAVLCKLAENQAQRQKPLCPPGTIDFDALERPQPGDRAG